MKRSISREQFLNERREEISRLQEINWLFPDTVIFSDPEDDIICDVCNNDILEETVHIEDEFAKCESCLSR